MAIFSAVFGGIAGFVLAMLHVIALGGSLFSGIAIWGLVGLACVGLAVALTLNTRHLTSNFGGLLEG